MKIRAILLTLSIITFSVLKSYSQDTEFTGYATALMKQDSIIKTEYFGFSNKEKLLK